MAKRKGERNRKKVHWDAKIHELTGAMAHCGETDSTTQRSLATTAKKHANYNAFHGRPRKFLVLPRMLAFWGVMSERLTRKRFCKKMTNVLTSGNHIARECEMIARGARARIFVIIYACTLKHFLVMNSWENASRPAVGGFIWVVISFARMGIPTKNPR